MIIQFLVSLAATLSFAVLFSAEKKQLFFCGLTGALGWIVYLICLQYHTDNAIANLIATFALTLVARILSAVRRTPVTVFLLTGIFPLVPGAGIYYTSYYFIMGDMYPVICNCTSSRLERTPYGRACKFLQDHPSCLHQHCRDQRVRSY